MSRYYFLSIPLGLTIKKIVNWLFLTIKIYKKEVRTHAFLLVTLMLSSLLFISCQNDFVPKPRGFQRIDLPVRKYKEFSSDCGFNTQIPIYAEAMLDQNPTSEKCWYNVTYIPFNATLHVSYKKYNNNAEMLKLTEDARTLVYKHTIKADEIYETEISNAYLRGMLYELSGNTATNFQFYVLDSNGNFMRGALYFNVKTNTDSVAPALSYLKEDILHSLQQLKWKM